MTIHEGDAPRAKSKYNTLDLWRALQPVKRVHHSDLRGRRMSVADYTRAWRAKHPEYNRDYMRRWRAVKRERAANAAATVMAEIWAGLTQCGS